MDQWIQLNNQYDFKFHKITEAWHLFLKSLSGEEIENKKRIRKHKPTQL